MQNTGERIRTLLRSILNRTSIEHGYPLSKDKKIRNRSQTAGSFMDLVWLLLYHKKLYPVIQECSAGMFQDIFFFAIRESFQEEFCGLKDYFYKRFSAWIFIERTPDASCSL